MKKKICGIVAAVMSATMFLSGCSLNKMTLDDLKTASLTKVDEMFDVKDVPAYNTADISMSVEIPKETIDRVTKALELEGTGYDELLNQLPKLAAEFNASVLQQDKNGSGTMSVKLSGVSDATITADFAILDKSLYLLIKDYAKNTALFKDAYAETFSDVTVNGVTADMNMLNSIHQATRDIVAACNDIMTEKNTVYTTKDVTMSVGDNTVEASKFVTTLEHEELVTLVNNWQKTLGGNDVIKAFGENNEKFAAVKDNWSDIATRLKEDTTTSCTNTIYVIDNKVVGFEFAIIKEAGNTVTFAIKECEVDGVYWYEGVFTAATGEDDTEPADVRFIIDAAPKSDKADNVHITYSYTGISDGDDNILDGSGTFPLYNVDLEALSNNLIRGTMKLNGTTCGESWSESWSEFKDEYGIDLGVNLDVYMETVDDVKLTTTIMDGEKALGTITFKCKMGVSDTAVTAPTENVETYNSIDEYWATLDVEPLAMDLLSALGLQDLLGGYDDSYGGFGEDDAYTYNDNDFNDTTDYDWYADLYGDSTGNSSDDWFAELYS